MEEIRIIGIAGGSGSGKSTLATLLYNAHPGQCVIVHGDDYFKKKEEVPLSGENYNFDHPTSLRMDELYRDIVSLQNGHPVTILTKSELYNPLFRWELKNKIEYTLQPKPIIIVEGYLVFHDQKIRELMDNKIYLDMPITESAKRRSGNKPKISSDYSETVLFPMHKQFVEPTKQYADLVINVLNKTAEEVFILVESKLFS